MILENVSQLVQTFCSLFCILGLEGSHEIGRHLGGRVHIAEELHNGLDTVANLGTIKRWKYEGVS